MSSDLMQARPSTTIFKMAVEDEQWTDDSVVEERGRAFWQLPTILLALRNFQCMRETDTFFAE